MKKFLQSFKEVLLAEQDFMNAIVYHNQKLVYRLPCEYNIQLNDLARPDQFCYMTKNELKVISNKCFLFASVMLM